MSARATSAAPVVIVRHPKENLRKCSVEPLRGRDDLPFPMRFITWPVTPEAALADLDASAGFVRLDPDGAPIGPEDAARGLVLIDATWRLAIGMHATFATVPARSLGPGWRTAYPRTSKLFDDPDEGLATVEALHAALVRLGRPDADTVLRNYRWADEWRERNADRLDQDLSEGSPESASA